MVSANCTRRLANGSMSRPNWVSCARRVDRSNSREPRCRSRAAIRRLATGWGVCTAAAPAVKPPVSLTPTNARQLPIRSTTTYYARTAWYCRVPSWAAWEGIGTLVTMARLIVLIAFVLTACGAAPPAPPVPAQPSLAPPPDFARLEAAYAARLGVYAVDTGSGREVAYHAEDRFAYASTHKVLTASLILRKTPIDGLNRKITYG